MVDSSSKLKSNSPWHTDGKALFGKDRHVPTWQESQIAHDVRFSDLDDDGRCHDEDPEEIGAAFQELRRGGKRTVFQIGAKSRERAEQLWLSDRGRHEVALEESRVAPVVVAVSVVPTQADDEKPFMSKAELGEWIVKSGRLWSTLIEVFGSRLSITDMANALWEKQHGQLPMSDKMVLIVHKSKTPKKIYAAELSIVPFSESTWKAVPATHVRMTLQRNPDGSIVPALPTRGYGAKDLMASWVATDSRQVIGERTQSAIIATSVHAKGEYQKKQQPPAWNEFCDFIRANAADVVMMMNSFQSATNPDAELLPDVAVISALWAQGRANAIRLLMDDEAQGQRHQYARLWMRRYDTVHYWPMQLRGSYVVDEVMAWFAGMGHAIVEPIEKRMVVSALRSGGNSQTGERIPWNDFPSYVRDNAQNLGERFAYLHMLFSGPDAETPQRFLLKFERTVRGGAEVLEDLFLSDGDDVAALKSINSGGILWKMNNGRLVPERVCGYSSFEVALAWLAGVGLVLHGLVERATVLGMLKSKLAPQGAVHRVHWGDVKGFLAGGHFALERLRLIYEAMKGEPAPKTLFWVGLKTTGDDAVVGSFDLMSEEDVATRFSGRDDQYFKVRFTVTDDGFEFQASGKGGRELVDVLSAATRLSTEGGITLFPDAGRMEDAAQRAIELGKENFGNLDEQLCKPEPLFTPAELMPVPQLERPADGVKLPEEGGFQATGPEVVKTFATPPSDKIPVITAVSAMVVGVIAFFYGGAALLRTPMVSPAFGSCGVFVGPRERDVINGT